MTLHIGEISNDVRIDGSPRPESRPAGPAEDRGPEWAQRDRHRRRAEAEARDASRTAEEARHG
ncbi:hypothetical protein ABZ951_15065 [Streptomyces sp. NPDC046215]|uniref:Uncharacterized protein n=1 Tax=Streptomyces stramineus TaxID=173861 RepID=A0ABP3L9G3_9ACTN